MKSIWITSSWTHGWRRNWLIYTTTITPMNGVEICQFIFILFFGKYWVSARLHIWWMYCFENKLTNKPTMWWRDTIGILIICLIYPIHRFMYFVNTFRKRPRYGTHNTKMPDMEFLLIVKKEKWRMAGYLIEYPYDGNP